MAGKMPPRKPTTRKYPRAPKLKEPDVGEGSSPAVARQLEFTPKIGARHQDIHQGGFHSASGLWRHIG
jgi:hypothetical protein